MKEYKRLKDPIYGYVNIPTKYMTEIIDTSCFQRLRRIIQTSYSPLYSSALHNRFVHSIGVYHLGEIAFNKLSKEISLKSNEKINFKSKRKIFLIACLLHDVGHAPFSHTGESFYLGKNNTHDQLHEKLVKRVKKDTFTNDIPQNESNAAAPHEIMSAIVGLKEYRKFFRTDAEREFFARCITGYKYTEDTSQNSLNNCFIALLNSKVIDVDKLDYLIRDAYTTGFDTVNIDFERLLTSLTVVSEESENEQSKYKLAYTKNAISVIENVVYAHDSERKWIQNHPIVLYEMYLLKHIFSNLSDQIEKKYSKQLFSLESLGEKGQQFSESLTIRLMCDDDIISLMKNNYYDAFSKEFFERRARRHPIWKSESEYNAFFLSITSEGELLDNLEYGIESTAKYLEKSNETRIIDKQFICRIEKELNELEAVKASLGTKTKEVQFKSKSSILKVLYCLNDFASKKNIECNFVLLTASQFNSGFSKPDFSGTKIVFSTDTGVKVKDVGDVVSSLKAKDVTREMYFYLYYKRNHNMSVDLDCQELCKDLIKAFI